MQTHKAKRVEITIEKIMLSRLTRAIEGEGVTGYSVLPVFGGSGRSGAWTREGSVSPGEGMVQLICIIHEDALDAMLEAAFSVVERHIGVVCITDCDVLRAERF